MPSNLGPDPNIPLCRARLRQWLRLGHLRQGDSDRHALSRSHQIRKEPRLDRHVHRTHQDWAGWAARTMNDSPTVHRFHSRLAQSRRAASGPAESYRSYMACRHQSGMVSRGPRRNRQTHQERETRASWTCLLHNIGKCLLGKHRHRFPAGTQAGFLQSTEERWCLPAYPSFERQYRVRIEKLQIWERHQETPQQGLLDRPARVW